MPFRKITLIITSLALIAYPLTVNAKVATFAEQMTGKILIQYQNGNAIRYVSPKNNQRYSIQNAADAYSVMRMLSHGITEKDLAKIPTKRGQKYSPATVKKFSGAIVIEVEKAGEAWYVSPATGLRYYLTDGDTALALFKKLGVKITNTNLKKITINHDLETAYAGFNDVAHVSYDGATFSNAYNADQVLPLASLTKLMTALVLLDQPIDWDKKITITKNEIDYPIQYVGTDATSEVGIAAGDTVSFYDLWVAMLLSSANRAAAALVDSTGMSRAHFATLMTQKAKSLGLEKTIFYDVAGLSERNVTTAREMAIIAYTAFNNSKIADTTIINSYDMNATKADGTAKVIKALNRNASLMVLNPDGVKVGFLTEAQRTVAIKKGNIIGVVMHALSHTQRDDLTAAMIQ